MERDRHNDLQVTKEKYIKKKEWDKEHQNGSVSYQIVGALGNKRGGVKGCLLFKDGRKHPYYEILKEDRYHRIKGYQQVDDETYVAVLKLRIGEWIASFMGMAAVVLLVFLLLGNIGNGKKEPDIDKGSGKYTPDNNFTEQSEPNKIILPGYKDIRMRAEKKTANIALWNPDTNPCYFKFIITEKENHEVIYESGLVPPGEAVTKITFKQEIPKGIHEATLTIKTYNLKDYEQRMNGGEVKIRIIALEKQE